jgi:hypothetical protein
MLEFEPGQHLQEGDIRMAKKRFQAEQIIGKGAADQHASQWPRSPPLPPFILGDSTNPSG